MKKYHVWTKRCQMTLTGSQRLESALERVGCEQNGRAEDADVIVLNTCVMSQPSEDKAAGRLSSLRLLKKKNHHLVIDTAELQGISPFTTIQSLIGQPAPSSLSGCE
jgi:tRNA-2-methylthio-N6-dimethylallyladenosine synthase